MDRLPIDDALPELLDALRGRRRAVLHAPPGAGKTTRVPLAMLEAGIVEGRILMLEPRRIAARMAAARMAETLGEMPGQTVGYRIRGEAKVSRETRLEVVTEGILTRMIQSDPGLDSVGAVIFDEFHERSLHADLGLALTLDVAGTLREDLTILVMSATLDAVGVAALLGDAPVVSSEGRSFPVEERYLDAPWRKERRFEDGMAELVSRAFGEEAGDMLVFLPGEGEIRRVAERIGGLDADLRPLYGALPFAAQRRALAGSDRRRIVLATAIAETSLTIPGVRVVVDGGLARRARFSPGSGMTRLVTDKVSRAEAEQRKGRAGRIEDGVCYRAWTRGEHGGLPAFAPPEIEVADLSGLALELAEWGSDDLAFLTPPPDGAMIRAQALLEALGVLEDGSVTAHGREVARLPVHPRLGHMLVVSGREAAGLAALLSERDPMREAGADLSARLRALRVGDGRFASVRAEAKRIAKRVGPGTGLTEAQMAALAYPDRIALRRPGDAPRWLLSGGGGVFCDAGEALAGARLLVVTDTDGNPREARIRQAVEIGEGELRDVPGLHIETTQEVIWDSRAGRVAAVEEERIGAVALYSKTWRGAPEHAVTAAMLDGVREFGFTFSARAERLRKRVALARAEGVDLPDMAEDALMAGIEDWLAPYLSGVKTAEAWRGFDVTDALLAMIDWDGRQALDRVAPEHFETPLGRRVAIDYEDGAPNISVRLQEMFGVTRHPVVAGRPLRITLLSPAQRPVQTTMDLPGFWATSYADVRKDMRGRYPKHPWPEDPTVEAPTLRAKRRGN